jgi:hypothetical protein
MKGAFLLALVLSCIATVCAKMPWGLSGRRVGGTVKTGSAKESLHAGDKTNCRVGRDVKPERGGDDIPPSSSPVEDDVKPARDGDDIPPSNTPPSQTHGHHKGGFSMSPASFCENGLTNAGCCLANGNVEASENIRKGMVAIGVCMIVSSNENIVIGVCKAVSSWWRGRA